MTHHECDSAINECFVVSRHAWDWLWIHGNDIIRFVTIRWWSHVQACTQNVQASAPKCAKLLGRYLCLSVQGMRLRGLLGEKTPPARLWLASEKTWSLHSQLCMRLSGCPYETTPPAGLWLASEKTWSLHSQHIGVWIYSLCMRLSGCPYETTPPALDYDLDGRDMKSGVAIHI